MMTDHNIDGFGFVLREGFFNFLRNRTLSLAMAGSAAIAVFALGAVALAAVNVNQLLKEWENKVELVAFLQHKEGPDEARAVLSQIQAVPQVKEARLVSKQDSWLQLFSESDSSLNLGRVALNELLPPTVVIKLKAGNHSLAEIKEISRRISAFEGVDEVKFEEMLLEQYFRFRRKVAAFALGINVFWLLIFGIITVNIARLASTARSDEMHTLHMLGASNGVIRKIFSVEGLLQGMAGACVGTAALIGLTYLISQMFDRTISSPFTVVAAVFAVGPVLAVLASLRIFRKAALVLVVGAFFFTSSSGLIRADELDSEVAKYREELERLRGELEQSKSAASEIAVQERALAVELMKIDKEINDLNEGAAIAREKMAENKSTINEAKVQLLENEKKLSESRRDLEQWLRMLCIRRMPSVAEVIFLDLPQSDITLRKYVIQLLAQKEAEAFTRTEELRTQYAQLQGNLRKRSELDSLYVETERLQLQQLLEKKEQREELLARLHRQKNIYTAAINDLEASSENLQLLLESDQLRQNSKVITSVPFREMKRLLPWPVEGKITAPFGRMQNPDSRTYTRHLGIDISAPVGSEIHVVHDGQVVYCDWFRGYGKLVIVDHGDGYSSIYSHCADTFVKKGDFIRAGALLALVGETGSLKGPFLYFEIREDGQPVDPVDWLQRRM